MARISCAKDQLSRCLLHADWMILNKALFAAVIDLLTSRREYVIPYDIIFRTASFFHCTIYIFLDFQDTSFIDVMM